MCSLLWLSLSSSAGASPLPQEEELRMEGAQPVRLLAKEGAKIWSNFDGAELLGRELDIDAFELFYEVKHPDVPADGPHVALSKEEDDTADFFAVRGAFLPWATGLVARAESLEGSRRVYGSVDDLRESLRPGADMGEGCDWLLWGGDSSLGIMPVLDRVSFQGVELAEVALYSNDRFKALSESEVEESSPDAEPPLELVFVVDVTQSMGDVLPEVREWILKLQSALEAGTSQELRLGVVVFRDEVKRQIGEAKGAFDRRRTSVGNLTDVVSALEPRARGSREWLDANAVKTLRVSTGAYPEAGLNGLLRALSMGWGHSSDRHIVLITDAPVRGADGSLAPRGVSLSTLRERLKASELRLPGGQRRLTSIHGLEIVHQGIGEKTGRLRRQSFDRLTSAGATLPGGVGGEHIIFGGPEMGVADLSSVILRSYASLLELLTEDSSASSVAARGKRAALALEPLGSRRPPYWTKLLRWDAYKALGSSASAGEGVRSGWVVIGRSRQVGELKLMQFAGAGSIGDYASLLEDVGRGVADERPPSECAPRGYSGASDLAQLVRREFGFELNDSALNFSFSSTSWRIGGPARRELASRLQSEAARLNALVADERHWAPLSQFGEEHRGSRHALFWRSKLP